MNHICVSLLPARAKDAWMAKTDDEFDISATNKYLIVNK